MEEIHKTEKFILRILLTKKKIAMFCHYFPLRFYSILNKTEQGICAHFVHFRLFNFCIENVQFAENLPIFLRFLCRFGKWDIYVLLLSVASVWASPGACTEHNSVNIL